MAIPSSFFFSSSLLYYHAIMRNTFRSLSLIFLLLLIGSCFLKASERLIYTSALHDWGSYPSQLQPDSFSLMTRYTEESLTISFQQVLIRPDGCSSSFYGGQVHPLAMTERKATPYILTSPLRSLTRVRFMQGATGGNCGFRLEAWGEGDSCWVTLFDERLRSGMHEQWVNVERRNVRLRFSNTSSSQNSYLFELDLYAEVPDQEHPRLDKFTFASQTYAPGAFVSRNADQVLEGTVHLSKQLAFPSSDHPLNDLQTLGGELTDIQYNQLSPLHTQVAMTVRSASGEQQRYLLHFVGKPDFTISYLSPQGRLLCQQYIEQDAQIGQFACTIDRLSITAGQQFRGWFDQRRNGHLITPDHIVTGPMTLHAAITDVEGPSGHRRWFYDLRNPDFQPAHHEAFLPEGDYSYVGRQHGWTFQAGSVLHLLVGSDTYLVLGGCSQHPVAMLVGQDTLQLRPTVEGNRTLYHYQGAEGRLTLRFLEPTTLHTLAIDNVADRPIQPDASGYYRVQPGDVEHLLMTLDVVNHRNADPSSSPAHIFIPDGDYDMGITSLTPISGHNISLIGQSKEGTILRNLPWIEGIGTATLLNIGRNNYLQDLTLQNDLDYYADTEAGRAPCLQDVGQHTICKGVRMLSYQDTYYSCGPEGQQLYWEDSELHGSFDFLCGRGTVFYNRVDLVLESMEREPGRGEAIITAPYTIGQDMGYVFDHCRVYVGSQRFNWGRAWGGTSHCAFLYTQIPADSLLIPTRYEPEGMNSAATHFFEYQTRDSEGHMVTPPSNIVHFTHQDGDQTYETVLTDRQAEKYRLDSLFIDWHPSQDTKQICALHPRLKGRQLKWKSPYPTAAMIVVDGQIEAIVWGNKYRLGVKPKASNQVYIRLANRRGGFGPAVCANL